MRDDTLLTPGEAAQYRRNSRSTLAKERMRGDGPAFLRIRGRIFYRKADIDDFLQRHVLHSTSEGTEAAK